MPGAASPRFSRVPGDDSILRPVPLSQPPRPDSLWQCRDFQKQRQGLAHEPSLQQTLQMDGGVGSDDRCRGQVLRA